MGNLYGRKNIKEKFYERNLRAGMEHDIPTVHSSRISWPVYQRCFRAGKKFTRAYAASNAHRQENDVSSLLSQVIWGNVLLFTERGRTKVFSLRESFGCVNWSIRWSFSKYHGTSIVRTDCVQDNRIIEFLITICILFICYTCHIRMFQSFFCPSNFSKLLNCIFFFYI